MGSALRPSTWVNYRNYLDAYVIPVIGKTALQDLNALRLNLLYAHLLEAGRVKTAGGLAPPTRTRGRGSTASPTASSGRCGSGFGLAWRRGRRTGA